MSGLSPEEKIEMDLGNEVARLKRENAELRAQLNAPPVGDAAKVDPDVARWAAVAVEFGYSRAQRHIKDCPAYTWHHQACPSGPCDCTASLAKALATANKTEVASDKDAFRQPETAPELLDLGHPRKDEE